MMNDLGSVPDVSIIIPAYNECESLPVLIPQVNQVMSTMGKAYEILVINDGSTDDTNNTCRKIIKDYPTVKMIEMLTNNGKALALQAGFQTAKGDIVITMDADLQDDPLELPRFIQQIENGYDMVVGWKKDRKDPLEKTLPSRLFNKVTSLMVGLDLHDYNCGFKAYKRYALRGLNLYGDMHRYIPAILFKQGFKITEIAIEHHARKFGKSKYGIERYTRGFLDLITILFLTNYKTRPLHLIGGIGLSFLGVGTLIDLYLVVLWVKGNTIGDRPLLTLGTLLIIVGVQTILNGLLAEMIHAMLSTRTDVLIRIRQIISHQDLDES
jgi:glycosyltransferase involved in cell wall biosynthesis